MGGGLAYDERWKRPNADAPPVRAPGGGNANLSRDLEVLFDGEFLQLAHDCFFPMSSKIQHAGDIPPPRISSSLPDILDCSLATAQKNINGYVP